MNHQPIVSDLRKHATWIGAASLWAFSGLAAFMAISFSPPPSEVTGSALSVLAVLVCGISILVRRPILTSPTAASHFCSHVVWLLAGFATANWLGYFMLRSSTLLDAVPIALIFLTSETWFHLKVARQQLPWLFANISLLGNQLATTSFRSHSSIQSESQDESCCLATTLAREISTDTEDGLADNISRRTIHGIDASGSRYASGTVRVSLATGQLHETVVVGFCPAFEGDPSVDFDHDADGVSLELVNCTPTGMRVAIRRRNTELPLVFELHWYAAQVELSQRAAKGTAKSILP